MKFLVDANLAPRVAARLGQAGHEASHVDEIGMGTASDEAILDRAHDEAAVVLTATPTSVPSSHSAGGPPLP